VPDIESLPAFLDSASKEGLGDQTREAARNLDNVLADLVANFAEGTEYFQILVKIFQPVLNAPSQTHLHNFYAIVPALTLNFVERMLSLKEKLGKVAARHEAAFTDDGFALGLAYILRILDQHTAFNSLHWFESVNNHMTMRRAEGAKLKAQLAAATSGKGSSQSGGANGSSSSSTAQEEVLAHGVAMKKLSLVQTEFDLFFYSFSGATIFFQDGAAAAKVAATGVEGAAKEAPSAATPAAADGAVPAAPAADGSAAPPPAPPMDVPVAPPMDGGFVGGAAAPPAPPMIPGADGTVLGVGAPPAPPPDF
jgi:WASH complex subunit 7